LHFDFDCALMIGMRRCTGSMKKEIRSYLWKGLVIFLCVTGVALALSTGVEAAVRPDQVSECKLVETKYEDLWGTRPIEEIYSCLKQRGLQICETFVPQLETFVTLRFVQEEGADCNNSAPMENVTIGGSGTYYATCSVGLNPDYSPPSRIYPASGGSDWCANLSSIGSIPVYERPPETNAEDSGSTCQIEGFWSFILCPTINLVAMAADSFSQMIEDKLAENRLIDNGNAAKIQTGWDKFRNIANVALAIVLVVIIIGTAIGGDGTGFFSNYSVKKALPRLVIGAIAVNVSFYVCLAAADVSQIVGAGIGDIINGLVSGDSANPDSPAGGTSGWAQFALSVTSAAIALTVTVAVIGVGPIAMIAILVILIVVLFFMLTLVLLAFRHLLLIGLVMISPLAFTAVILPNTESLFKKWWGMYWKLLMIYPIFVFIRAVCKEFSKLVGGW
jgi:hypothetical protein